MKINLLEFDKITHQLKETHYKKGDIVFHEGKIADRFYIVKSGKVKLYKAASDGREHILHVMTKGDLIAEVPMFEGECYPVSCAAMSEVTLLSLTREKFINTIQQDPDIALEMLALQAKRLRDFAAKIERLTLKNTEQRIADYLLEQVENNNLYMQDLANYVGASREAVSRIINRWAKSGFIKKDAKTITIIEKKKLEAL